MEPQRRGGKLGVWGCGKHPDKEAGLGDGSQAVTALSPKDREDLMGAIKLWSDPEGRILLESMGGMQQTGHGEMDPVPGKEFIYPAQMLSPSSELGLRTQSLD